MPAYIMRVELYGVADYGYLNEAMQEAGFRTTVKDDALIEYHLPTGMYDLPSGAEATMGRAIRRAQAAITRALQQESPELRKLNKEPAILLVDADLSVGWVGLTPVL